MTLAAASIGDKPIAISTSLDKGFTFVNMWGSFGKGNGRFDGPAGLSIDKNDNIYVTDKNNNRIQVFTAN